MRDKERQRIHNPGRIAYPAKGEYGKQQRTTGKPAGLYYAFSRLCDRVRQCMEVPLDVRTKRRRQLHADLRALSDFDGASGDDYGIQRGKSGADKPAVYVSKAFDSEK